MREKNAPRLPSRSRCIDDIRNIVGRDSAYRIARRLTRQRFRKVRKNQNLTALRSLADWHPLFRDQDLRLHIPQHVGDALLRVIGI